MASTKVPSELIADAAITGSKLHTALGNTGVTANSSGLHIGQDVATSSSVQFQTVTGSHAGTIASATTGTTQANTDNSAKIATTAFVTNKITELIGGAPSTLNDLNELAAAINDDANYNTTLTTALATKAPIASPTFTGTGRMNGDWVVGAATGEDKFVTAPQTAGSGTILISYNDAGNAYEPLKVDFENLELRTSGTPRLSIDSSGNIALAGNLTTTGTIDGVDIAARDAILTSTTSALSTKLSLAGGTMTGNLVTGDGTNIGMDSSANGQLEVDGNGYKGAIALDSSAMHIYHNSSSRDLVLGTDETARLTIAGNSGHATFVAGATFADDVAINNGSPEMYFGTTGNHYNWRIAAQELEDAAFEIAVGSQDTNYADDTYAKVFHIKNTGDATFTGAITAGGKGYFGPVGTGDATTKAEMDTYHVLKLKPHDSNSTNMTFAQVDGGSSMGIQVSNGPQTANWDIALNPFGGNVGIGTKAPGERLEVDGIVQINRTGDHPAIRFSESDTVRAYMGSGDWAINGGNVDDFGISSSSTGDLLLGTTAGVERMRIENSSGYVGIGTNDPDSRLHVYHGTQDNTTLTLENYLATASGAQYLNWQELLFQAGGSGPYAGIRQYANGWQNSDAALAFWTQQHGGSYAERMRINGDGQVGINTTDPQAHLHVVGTGQFDMLTVERTTSTPGMKFVSGADTAGTFGFQLMDNNEWWAGRYTGSDYDYWIQANQNALRVKKPISSFTTSGTKQYSHLCTGSFYSSTGAIIIDTNIPAYNESGNANMFSLKVRGYEYAIHGSIDLNIGGYVGENNHYSINYNGTYVPEGWIDNIKFCKNNTTGKLAIQLGSTSANQKIEMAVVDFIQGYINVDEEYAQGWSMSCLTDLSNYSFFSDVPPRVASPRPGFHAYLNATTTFASGTSPRILSSTSYNRGSHYNTGTGRFTAPTAGVYHFDMALQLQSTTTNLTYISAEARVNGSTRYIGGWFGKNHSGSSYAAATGSVTIPLARNDYVEFVSELSAAHSVLGGAPGYTYLSGIQIA